MTTDLSTVLAGLAGLSPVELGHLLRPGMVCSPTQPGFQTAMIHRHGDHVWPDGTSAAFELIVMGTHVGTHVDAACHVSGDGVVHGGHPADRVLPGGGFTAGAIDTVEPLVGRGVLVDLATDSPLAPAHAVSAAELATACVTAGIEPAAGDVVCVRTGWARHFDEPETYSGRAGGAPGLATDAAQWLAARRVRAVGADVMAFEAVPADGVLAGLATHRVLLVEAGINIIENLDLEALADTGASEFLFVALPLRITGGTASPIRPLALVPAS